MTIIYAEAFTGALGFRVLEGVNALYSLSQVPTHMSNNLEELILIELFRNPKSEILVTCRVLRVGFELGDFVVLELVDEAGVLTPEKANVINIKELHSPAFKAETKGPTDLSLKVLISVEHNSIMDNTRAKYLKPFIIIENL